MSLRRMLLIVLLTALGLCAAGGMLALVATSHDMVWQMVGTAFVTAVATGMLLPLTLLVERPRFRAGGINAMVIVAGCWSLVCLLIWVGAMGLPGVEERLLVVLGELVLFGVPSAGALLLVSFRWARGAVYTGVVAAGVGLVLSLMGGIMPSRFYFDNSLSTSLLSSGMTIALMGAVAATLLVNVGCGDRRYFRWPAVGLCGVVYALMLMSIWGGAVDDPFWHRVFAAMVIAPAALGWANLVLMARLDVGQRWVLLATLACVAVAGAAAIGSALIEGFEFDAGLLFRLSAAAAIAGACGSLALVVLALFNRRQLVGAMSIEFHEITLVCPGCSTRQALPLGNAVCRVCALQIQIKVIEPQCAACGYLLYRIASDRCPECGEQIRKPEPAGAGAEGAVAAAPAVGGGGL